LLLDIHDLSPHMYKARFEGRPIARVVGAGLRAVQRLACALADRVITVHEPYRRQLANDGVPARKVSVIMNSADERLIERVVKKTKLRSDGLEPFTLAYHGTITHWYGVDLIVEALASLSTELPDARAVILGAGDAVESARNLARGLGVLDRLELPGTYVPIEQALNRVASASCGVIPNRPSTLNRFALSSKLFEYVALGIPVVVSRLETLAAHFGSDEVTFFEPGDADSLAEAARWVASNPQAAKDKAEAARQRAHEYSWRENGARFVDLLASLDRRAYRLARAGGDRV